MAGRTVYTCTYVHVSPYNKTPSPELSFIDGVVGAHCEGFPGLTPRCMYIKGYFHLCPTMCFLKTLHINNSLYTNYENVFIELDS